MNVCKFRKTKSIISCHNFPIFLNGLSVAVFKLILMLAVLMFEGCSKICHILNALLITLTCFVQT